MVAQARPLRRDIPTLIGDETDSHARFLEIVVNDIRIPNIYIPNGNAPGAHLKHVQAPHEVTTG
ncbi:MAG: hypothetical protein ACR2JB_03500 [Bryobacteraceae bacterium]